MLDSKKYIFDLLKASTPLVTACPTIVYMYPNDFNALPVVTYQETNNRNQDFFDNASFSDEVSVQIDVWTNVSTTAISKFVDDVFLADFWTRDFGSDVSEPNAKIFHKVLNYRRTFTPDDLDAI